MCMPAQVIVWDHCWKVTEAHMLKLQDELSQQKHPSQKSGNPECNDQPLQAKALMSGICILYHFEGHHRKDREASLLSTQIEDDSPGVKRQVHEASELATDRRLDVL